MPLPGGKIILRYGSSLTELGWHFSLQSQLAWVEFGPQPYFGKLFFILDVYGQFEFPSIEPFFHASHAILVCGIVFAVPYDLSRTSTITKLLFFSVSVFGKKIS